jgi:maleylpyruvate isomerase
LTDLGSAPGAGDGAPDAELASVLAGCRASHVRLLATVAGLDEADVRGPSRLEGWTVGHVLTHLARNADSHTRMLRAALGSEAVEAVEQYAGGHDERARAIEAGSDRPVGELRHDLERSTAELEATWAAMTPLAWDGHGLSRGEPWPCRTMPFFRWREVEIHHVDAGIGYDPDDWPEEYVRRELPLLVATLPRRLADGGQRRRLLAWLAGRAAAPGQLDLDRWESHRGNYFGTSKD